MFAAGEWVDVAGVEVTGHIRLGIQAPTYGAYTLTHAIDNLERRDAAALAWAYPVQLDAFLRATWPAFLVDLLPQGYGRGELLRRLELPEAAAAEADWPLLLAGAGNPIGHLRIKEAHEWLIERTGNAPNRGFTYEEVAARSDDFTELLASHGLFVAGSSGVQGEWPKILLTEAQDGLLYLDHTLADGRATRHWLVKFGRGADQALANILRLEAPYMRLAQALGLRVHGDLQLRSRALFVPRFDRQVTSKGVVRLAQESLASLCDIAEFGAAPSHNVALERIAAAASEPEPEVVEYVKRDVANLVLGNKDNHGRNTAIQRSWDGGVRLSPVFDFSAMLLHPDGIARRMRWARDDGGAPLWSSVLAQCREATGLALTQLPAELRSMAAVIDRLPALAIAEGVDADIVTRLQPLVRDVAAQLASL
jgi:serine/threonine-protein kinase HipA